MNIVLLSVVLVGACTALRIWRSADALDAVATYCAARSYAMRQYRISFRRAMESEENLRRNVAMELNREEAALDATT